MAKRKVIEQKNNKEEKEKNSDKRPVLFDVILILLIAVPFIILVFSGNVQTQNKSGNQSLSNSWQDASPAFSNIAGTPTITTSPVNSIPSYPPKEDTSRNTSILK